MPNRLAPSRGAQRSRLVCTRVPGALASGAGYALWYSVLPQMKATTAATLQLSVPVLTALMGVLFLAEAPGERLWLASLLVLGGIFLYLRNPQRTA